MTTIKVLVDTFKADLYQVVTDFYNQHKPKEWTQLISGRFAEGGFETALEYEFLQAQLAKGHTNKNSLFRQVRWSKGKLVSGYYIPFTKEQTALLFLALQQAFGAEKVIMV